ncbi:MAG: peptidylprolyl isomerase, partial [Bryobacteraceae bacterium]
FELRKGEVSGIFRTSFGFHIAKLHQKTPEGIWPLQEIRSKLASAIVETRKNVIVARFVAALRESAKIKRVSSQDEARV